MSACRYIATRATSMFAESRSYRSADATPLTNNLRTMENCADTLSRLRINLTGGRRGSRETQTHITLQTVGILYCCEDFGTTESQNPETDISRLAGSRRAGRRQSPDCVCPCDSLLPLRPSVKNCDFVFLTHFENRNYSGFTPVASSAAGAL